MRTQVIVGVAAMLGAGAIASTRGERSSAEHTVVRPSALKWVDNAVRPGGGLSFRDGHARFL